MKYKGGLTKGKSHAEGGIKMRVESTGQKIEVEGGEVIVNKKNVADETTLEFEGEQKTTCEILSDLNSRNGNGVTLECDSVEGKKYKHQEGGKLPKQTPKSDLEKVVKVEWVKNIGTDGWSAYMDGEDAYDNEGGYVSKNGNWKIFREGKFYERDWGENFERRGDWQVYSLNKYGFVEEHYGDFKTLSEAKKYVNNWIRINPKDYDFEYILKNKNTHKQGGKLPKKQNMENNSDYDTYIENKRIDLFAEYGMKIANIINLKNSLGINREDMPQIRSFAFNDFLAYLDENKVKHSYELIESKKLKPTQSQINVDKANQLTKDFVDSRFLIASNDNYILDGHHRWYYGLQNDGISKVLRVDMPIRELLDSAKAFDKTEFADIYAETIFNNGGNLSSGVEMFEKVKSKLIPSQQIQFLNEIEDPLESRDMLSNVVKAYQHIPSLYKQDGKGNNAVAYLHYFVGGIDWWVTEYDRSTGKMFGLSNLNNDWTLGYFDVSFFKDNELSPFQKPELDFYFKYQTINEILEKVYPEKVQPPIERYEQIKKENQGMLVRGTDWQKLIDANSFKNPFEKVQAIEKMIDEKGENPNNYSVTEKVFLSEYTGIGGMEKFGASRRDVGKGEESDVGLQYEFFTPDSLCRMMWGLAYKHSGDMQIKDVLEPSMGAGAFVGQAPLNVNVDGYDINKYCYMINKILYTEERFNFYHDSFEKLFIKNNRSVMGDVTPMYDLVIGNPPYGTYQGEYSVLGNAKSEKKHTKADNFIDYFISRGLDLLRPDGLLIYVIGSLPVFGSLPFLETEMKSSKRKIMSKCDLVDAYRLGTSMFEFTKVDADIIVLRKK